MMSGPHFPRLYDPQAERPDRTNTAVMVPPDPPRLYVEDLDLPPPEKTWHFVGRRWPFGLCTVSVYYRIEEEFVSWRELVPADWHGEYAEWVAREILCRVKRRNDNGIPKLFVEEVLSKLDADSWELPFSEVTAWGDKFEFPKVEWKAPSFEDEVRGMLSRLGMLDEKDKGQEGR